MLRLRNKRLSFNITVTEPVAANYYPVNAFITLKDPLSGNVLNVITDRSQGGSSMADGEAELMVQRRLQYDDNRGVGEPLNETGLDGNGLVVRGVHRVTLDPAGSAGIARRVAVNDMLFKPLSTFAPLATDPNTWISTHTSRKLGLTAPLPANVHLLTAQSWGPGQLLLRLSHQYEVGENSAMSKNATVSLSNLFAGFTITSVVETTITGNQPLAAVPKTVYVTQDGRTISLPVVPAAPAGAQLTLTLSAMQIRTFLCATTQGV
jgi:lysosomal alpha-mannosidase